MNNNIKDPEFVVPGALLILAGGIGIAFVLIGSLSPESSTIIGSIVGVLAGCLLMIRVRVGTLLYFLILGGLIILASWGLLSSNPGEWAGSIGCLVGISGFLSMGWRQICFHRKLGKPSDSEPPVVVKASRGRGARYAVVATAAYIVTFFPLWLGGGYILTESGRVRSFMGLPTGIAAPDVAEWQPLVGHFQPAYHWPNGTISQRCDFIGWLYYPFWSLVRLKHPSIALLDYRGWIVQKPEFPAGFSIHPLRGHELASIMADEPTTEQAGAGQPATKPADKPPVKDQPSTPTPKVVPR